MTSPVTVIDGLNWQEISVQLDAEGYALLPGLLSPASASELAHQFENLKGGRRESLAAGNLGRGELVYFAKNLLTPWASWRTAFYRHLVDVANRWNEILEVRYRYPSKLAEFALLNRRAGQTEGLSHLNRLGVEDYLGLHQRSEGDHVFPMQIVALLSAPVTQFQGGEFVMTEQRPRMQSRPIVLPLKRGDAAIICTAERPFKGTRGYYRVNLKHAISRVRGGERLGVELSFHDAPPDSKG